MPTRKKLNLLIVSLLLVVVAAGRAFLLDATVTEVTGDEVWSVWQTLGTPLQIIQWTPYDWPPGYYLALGAWRSFTGLNPIALRWLSVLAFMIGAAAFYRAARRLHGDGIIAMLVYGALNFLIFLSTELRGYALLLALFPLALWLALRYLDYPKVRRAVPLALTMAAMVYVSLTSVPALGALALFTLIVYRRGVWRWWLPGVIAGVLALPELIQKASVAVVRTSAVATIVLKPFFAGMEEMYTSWSGTGFVLWLALFVLAALLLLRARRYRVAIALIVWSLLPIFLYASNAVLGFFNVRYAWWVTFGIVLLLSLGLARLPRLGRAAASAVFIALMLLTVPMRHYQIYEAPFGQNFDWLTRHWQPGDVLLIDPNCNCAAPEIFDYYTQVYFPHGLTFVTDPANYRRIWYITGTRGATPAMRSAVEQGRRSSIFVGPPEALFRLYEAPPDAQGIAYPNGMRFHGIDVLDKADLPVYHEGDPLHVRLWWSADKPPTLDYSLGLFIVDDSGQVLVQSDGPPDVADAPTATSQWQPGQIYVEEHTFQLPYPLPHGHYRLMMAVYWYGDDVRLSAPGVNADGLQTLLNFTVTAWPH